MVQILSASGLAKGERLIIERPFGGDLAFVCTLNKILHSVFEKSHLPYRSGPVPVVDQALGGSGDQHASVLAGLLGCWGSSETMTSRFPTHAGRGVQSKPTI